MSGCSRPHIHGQVHLMKVLAAVSHGTAKGDTARGAAPTVPELVSCKQS